MLLPVSWLIARLRVHRSPLKSDMPVKLYRYARLQYLGSDQTVLYRINLHGEVNNVYYWRLTTVLTVTLLSLHSGSCTSVPYIACTAPSACSPCVLHSCF
jgi:hypothetical protein